MQRGGQGALEVTTIGADTHGDVRVSCTKGDALVAQVACDSQSGGTPRSISSRVRRARHLPRFKAKAGLQVSQPHARASVGRHLLSERGQRHSQLGSCALWPLQKAVLVAGTTLANAGLQPPSSACDACTLASKRVCVRVEQHNTHTNPLTLSAAKTAAPTHRKLDADTINPSIHPTGSTVPSTAYHPPTWCHWPSPAGTSATLHQTNQPTHPPTHHPPPDAPLKI